MKVTGVTFLIGCLAIAGIPGLSGFFSKDEILASVYAHSPVMYYLALGAALMTAFYMFRLYFLTFTGKFRGTHEQEHHLHESPAAITIPLVILAILAIVGGYVGLPAVISEHHTLNTYLAPVVSNFNVHHLEHATEWILMGLSTGLVIIMIIFAYTATKKPNFAPNTGIAKVLENKWYVDELYDAVIVRPLGALSVMLNNIIEKLGIDGAVNGAGKLVNWSSGKVRLVQSGQVGFYIFAMVLGITVLFAISFFWIQ